MVVVRYIMLKKMRQVSLNLYCALEKTSTLTVLIVTETGIMGNEGVCRMITYDYDELSCRRIICLCRIVVQYFNYHIQ